MNYPKDSVEVQTLADGFKDVYKNMGANGFDLKEYNGLWDSCAPRPSLGDLDHLIKCLLKVSPGLNVGYNSLVQALGNTCHDVECATLLPKKIASKLLVVQKHIRNLKFGTSSQQALKILEKKCTTAQWERLTRVLSSLKTKNSNTKETLQGETKGRELKKTISDVSMDGDGFPTWSFIPHATKDTGSTDADNGDLLLQGEHTAGIYKKQVHKKPASPKATGKPAKSKVAASKKAMKSYLLPTDVTINGPFKIHGPFMKTGKSYVTSDGRHVCTVTRKQCKDYHKAVLQIYNWILKFKKGMVTREEAKKKRAEILEKLCK